MRVRTLERLAPGALALVGLLGLLVAGSETFHMPRGEPLVLLGALSVLALVLVDGTSSWDWLLEGLEGKQSILRPTAAVLVFGVLVLGALGPLAGFLGFLGILAFLVPLISVVLLFRGLAGREFPRVPEFHPGEILDKGKSPDSGSQEEAGEAPGDLFRDAWDGLRGATLTAYLWAILFTLVC